jgi:hypothetical protein
MQIKREDTMKKMFYVSCAITMFVALSGCSRLRPVEEEAALTKGAELTAGSNEAVAEAKIYVYVKDLTSISSLSKATGDLSKDIKATATGDRTSPRSAMLFFLPLLPDPAKAKLILFEEGQECAANFDIKGVKNIYLRLTDEENVEFLMTDNNCIVKAKVAAADGAMAFITQIPAFASVAYTMSKPFVDVDAISIATPISAKDPYGQESVGLKR